MYGEFLVCVACAWCAREFVSARYLCLTIIVCYAALCYAMLHNNGMPTIYFCT